MENETQESIEENLPMVNYIMLHRIYDILTIIANSVVGGDEINKMVEYHKEGFLLGPAPAYTNEEESNG